MRSQETEATPARSEPGRVPPAPAPEKTRRERMAKNFGVHMVSVEHSWTNFSFPKTHTQIYIYIYVYLHTHIYIHLGDIKICIDQWDDMIDLCNGDFDGRTWRLYEWDIMGLVWPHGGIDIPWMKSPAIFSPHGTRWCFGVYIYISISIYICKNVIYLWWGS